jgi:hypothetical protein
MVVKVGVYFVPQVVSLAATVVGYSFWTSMDCISVLC